MENEMTAARGTDTVILFENGKTVSFPPTVTEIGYDELWGEWLTELRCGPAVKSIRAGSFCSAHLQRVRFSEGLEEIGARAFFGCHRLTELEIPRSVKSIGESAFTSCIGLRRVAILSPDTRLGENAFYNCPKDMRMVVPKDSPAENCAVEGGWRYTYPDGTAPEGLSRVRVSDDGTLLEHCYFRVEYLWQCSADSDGGIDDRKRAFAVCRIPSALLLVKDGAPVGVHGPEHDFLFADPSTHEFEKILDRSYAGGWGDVLESVTHRLFIGPVPRDADGLVTESRMPRFMHHGDWRLF